MKRLDSIALIVFSFLTLLIVFPLLRPGFILTMDFSPTARVAFPSLWHHAFLFQLVYYLLHLLIPVFILQKAFLILIFLTGFWGMYRLAPVDHQWIKITAGITYMVNPFTYARLTAGQWYLVFGYALLPFIFSRIHASGPKTGWRAVIVLALLLTLLATMSPHLLLLAWFYFFLFATMRWITTRQSTVAVMVRTIAVWVLLNSSWLFGYFSGSSGLARTIAAIGENDLITYQSVPDTHFGLLGNLLSGYGFWTEAQRYFVSSKDLVPIWPIFPVILLGVSLYGWYITAIRQNKRDVALAMGICALASLDLAVGIAAQHTAPLVKTLYSSVPVLRGLREPQKLIAMVMVFYAYFSAVGVQEIVRSVGSQKRRITILCTLTILPILWGLPLFFGFWGQIRPVWYPASWRQVNEMLTKDKDDFATVFFPWHQYLRFSFNNNIVVANPAPYFFDVPILISQDAETGNGFLIDSTPEVMHVRGLLRMQWEGKNFMGTPVDIRPDWASALSAIDVKYVILAKNDDLERYAFLETEPQLEKLFDDPNVALYRNLSWGIEEAVEGEEESI